jgi:hypothetical protein
MKRQPSPEVFLSKKLDDFLKTLPSNHKFVKWINDMADVLKENKLAGESIPKKQIPKEYIEQYNATNLYRYQHPEGYRSCYLILNKCPHILDIMSHHEYDKKFGYKTS